MLISYKRGQSGIVLRVKILNSSVSTGAGLTGLTSASSGLIISTIADNEATPTNYTVAGSTIESITTLGTYAAPAATKCRFKEVDATNHKGVYEIQIADARFAVSSAKSLLVSILGATNAAECDALIPLTDIDPYDAVRAGFTALPNAAAEAAGGLYTRGVGAGQINQPANGMIDTNPVRLGGTAQSLTDLKHFADSGYDPDTSKVQGVVLVDTLTTYTGNTLQTGDSFPRIGAAGAGLTNVPWNASWDAEVQGDVDEALVANGLDHLVFSSVAGADIADDSIIAKLVSKSATADWDDFVNTTESLQALRDRGDVGWITATGFSTHAAADVWTVTTRLLTAGTNIVLAKGVGVTGFNDPTAADNADAVWDEILAGHLGAGSTGSALNAAGGSGDPWSTSLPGVYGAGTAGFIVGTNIDALISSRLATSGYTAPLGGSAMRTALGLAAANLDAQLTDIPTVAEFNARTLIASAYGTAANEVTILGLIDTEVGAIKAKTDLLPSDPADASDIAASFVTVNTKLDAIDDYIDTEIAAIKNKTDLIPGDPADASDIAAAFAAVNSTLATVATYIDTEVAAVLAAVSSTGVVLTAAERNAITNAILDLANTIGTRSLREIFRLLSASQGGKVSGAGTTEVTIRDIDDTKDVVVADVDEPGNRIAVVLDLA